jgi:hypothetical protein
MKWHQSRWAHAVFASAASCLGWRRLPPRHRRTLRLEVLEDRSVPTTITPTTFADGGLGSGSLRDAVLQFNADAGTEDDTIQLLAGTYTLTIKNAGGVHETAGLTGDLNLTSKSHHLIIQGAGASTIIDASQLEDRVFEIVNPATQVVFQDLVIQGGLAEDNGTEGVLQGTTDALGGGILNDSGDITLDNVVVQNNIARGGDGLYAGWAGYSAGGGAIYSTGGTVVINGRAIANNQANAGQGGRGYDGYPPGPGGDGGAASGGGLYANGGSLDISGSMIANNGTAGGKGGRGGDCKSINGSCSGVGSGGFGGVGQGGGIYVNGASLTNSTSTIASNQGTGGDGGGGSGKTYNGEAGVGQGGGLYVASGSITLTNSLVATNAVRGGVSNGYTDGLHLWDSGAGFGGGLSVAGGVVSIRQTTVATNQAIGGAGSLDSINGGLGAGGGLSVTAGSVTIENTTVAANQAIGGTGYPGENDGGPGTGGGLWVSGSGSAEIFFSTVSTNRAVGSGGNHSGSATGGGLFNSGVFQARHTIVAKNTVDGPGNNSAPDLSGDLGSLGHNLVGTSDGSSGFDPSDLLDLDPLLGPLADNGGPTQTMALLPGSAAIDAGDNTGAPMWDQRGPGYPRIVNGIIDIGAFEYQGDGSGPAPSHVILDAAHALAVPPSLLPLEMDHPEAVSCTFSTNAAPNTPPADPAAMIPRSDSEDSLGHQIPVYRQKKDAWKMDAWWDHLEPGDRSALSSS